MELPLSIGTVLYPDFELLDTFGPLEMYTLLGAERASIHMIAEQAGPVASAMGSDGPLGPKVVADYSFEDAPALDIILLPGGFGTFSQLENQALLTFLRERAERATVVSSVCTGSALLARAGLLDGLRATRNKQLFELARSQGEQVEWVESARWVDGGKMVTSSGVSAGIDMTRAIIARLFDTDVAENIAVAAEYSWQRDSTQDPFAGHLNELAREMNMI